MDDFYMNPTVDPNTTPLSQSGSFSTFQPPKVKEGPTFISHAENINPLWAGALKVANFIKDSAIFTYKTVSAPFIWVFKTISQYSTKPEEENVDSLDHLEGKNPLYADVQKVETWVIID